MDKKLWNYAYSILLSVILLLLLGIFIHLGGNGNKITDLPMDTTSPSEETFLEEQAVQDKGKSSLLLHDCNYFINL